MGMQRNSRIFVHFPCCDSKSVFQTARQTISKTSYKCRSTLLCTARDVLFESLRKKSLRKKSLRHNSIFHRNIHMSKGRIYARFFLLKEWRIGDHVSTAMWAVMVNRLRSGMDLSGYFTVSEFTWCLKPIRSYWTSDWIEGVCPSNNWICSSRSINIRYWLLGDILIGYNVPISSNFIDFIMETQSCMPRYAGTEIDSNNRHINAKTWNFYASFCVVAVFFAMLTKKMK